MRRLAKLSDRDLDRILAGGASPDDPEATDLASFVRGTRSLRSIPASIEALHLTTMVDAARRLAPAAARSSTPARRRPRLRRTLVPAGVAGSILAKMAAATAVALTTVGGLTAAGVLPSDPGPPAVEESQTGERGFLPGPLDEDGVASEHASQTAKDVLAVIDGWLAGDYATGCEFGRAVAEAASGKAKGPCPSIGDEEGEPGHDRGRSEEARAKAAERSAAGKAKGAEASAQGKAKGAEASAQGKAKAAEKTAAGKAEGSEASSGGGGSAPQAPPSGGGGGGGSGGAPSGGSGGPPESPGKP